MNKQEVEKIVADLILYVEAAGTEQRDAVAKGIMEHIGDVAVGAFLQLFMLSYDLGVADGLRRAKQ